MKWYGRYVFSYEKRKSRLNWRSFYRARNLSQVKYSTYGNHGYIVSIFFPFPWKTVLLQQNSPFWVWYAYGLTYFFFLPIPKIFVQQSYDPCANVLTLRSFFKNNFYSLFWRHIKLVFFQMSKIFLLKLKFKGKGYYIYRNARRTVATQLGYSHINVVYSFFLNVKFQSKTSIMLFGINKFNLAKWGRTFYSLRPINIFTSKGIRFNKQIIYKKTGKISSYR